MKSILGFGISRPFTPLKKILVSLHRNLLSASPIEQHNLFDLNSLFQADFLISSVVML